jgi:hypothetical protein
MELRQPRLHLQKKRNHTPLPTLMPGRRTVRCIIAITTTIISTTCGISGRFRSTGRAMAGIGSIGRTSTFRASIGLSRGIGTIIIATGIDATNRFGQMSHTREPYAITWSRYSTCGLFVT